MEESEPYLQLKDAEIKANLTRAVDILNKLCKSQFMKLEVCVLKVSIILLCRSSFFLKF